MPNISAKRLRKRDGRIVDFDKLKIVNAVLAAFKDVDGKVDDYAEQRAKNISNYVEEHLGDDASVEDVQDMVEQGLTRGKRPDVGKAYIRYRYDHELARQHHLDREILNMATNDPDSYWTTENSNKNSKWVTTQRDYMAGIVSTDIARNYIFPKECVEAHDAGIIHIHDMDYMAQNTLHNCCLINLNDTLQNGTVVNGVRIDKPHRLITATTIATQVIAAVASSQYGGQTITLTHLAPFVRSSWNRYKDKYISWGFSEEDASKFADIDTKKEISDSIQTLTYQLNSLTTTNGQAPFISVCMYLGETEEYKQELALLTEETLKQRILGMKNRKGVYVTTAFPKLLYVLEEDNIHEDSKYWYLTELAAKCTAKRMVPDYISEKVMKELKLSKGETVGNGDCYPCMGCRSFLTPDRSGNGWNNVANALDYDNRPKYYGRFNIGVCSINLEDCALSAYKETGKDKENYQAIQDEFWSLLDERLELCHKVQRIRAERLSKTKAEVAPILWCDGSLARLQPEDTLDRLIHGGYATSSLGYAGLYEAVKILTGHSHTDNGIGHDVGIQIMKRLNDKCNEWKAAEDIDYSVYGTPIESTTWTFMKGIHKRFGYGYYPGITDREYITNSYHVPVFEKINPFSKLAIESEFQKLSPGGAISYIETSNLQGNIPAVLEVIKFIYDNIMYAELNTKSDYCQVCGYDGEVLLKYDEKNHKHYYECPNCGNKDTSKMNIARRVCGYISTTVPNEGRLDEIAHRYVHLDDHRVDE